MVDSNQHFINKSFREYCIPSVLAILGANISIMIDNLVAGFFLDSNALAAMSIVNPIFNLIAAFGILVCGGAGTLAAISLAENNQEKTKAYFSLCFFLCLILSGIVTVVGVVAINPITRLLVTDETLFLLAKDYSLVTFIGSASIIFIYFPFHFLRIKSKNQIAMRMFFIMSVFDILFDILFVVVFDYGMKGLSAATVLSATIAIFYGGIHLRKVGYVIGMPSTCRTYIKEMLLTGSPMALNNIYAMARVRVLNGVILSAGGSIALAAYACGNNINIVGTALIGGIAQTAATIVAIFYGERDSTGMRAIIKKATRNGMVITFCFMVVVNVFSSQIAMLFGLTGDNEQELVQGTILILSIYLFITLFSSILSYVFMSCKNTGLSNLLTFGKGFAFAIPLMILGGKVYGFYGVLLGMILSEVLSILGTVALSYYKRKKNPMLETLFLIDQRRFGQGQAMSCVVKNQAESIGETSAAAQEFCEEQGLTMKQAMTVGLGVEEIMMLMLQHTGLTENDVLDFRLFISKKEIIARIRCAGDEFNPLEYEPEDELDNMGVTMLLHMASDLSYTTSLGVNNVQVVIEV